jgi:hypothetical protein
VCTTACVVAGAAQAVSVAAASSAARRRGGRTGPVCPALSAAAQEVPALALAARHPDELPEQPVELLARPQLRGVTPECPAGCDRHGPPSSRDELRRGHARCSAYGSGRFTVTSGLAVRCRHMGRPTNRYAARREASLVRMAVDVTLPPREPGESQGAYYRRCAIVWLAEAGEKDPEERANVLRLGALARASRS